MKRFTKTKAETFYQSTTYTTATDLAQTTYKPPPLHPNTSTRYNMYQLLWNEHVGSRKKTWFWLHNYVIRTKQVVLSLEVSQTVMNYFFLTSLPFSSLHLEECLISACHFVLEVWRMKHSDCFESGEKVQRGDSLLNCLRLGGWGTVQWSSENWREHLSA